jgi:hypothetical protein
MKYQIFLSHLNSILFLILMPMVMYGQPKSGHFIYGLISYEIIDSSVVSEKDATSIIEYLKEEFTPELYFNKDWVVVVSELSRGSIKWMYNRKLQILYKYYDGKNNDVVEIRTMRVDSIQSLKQDDKVLLAAIDTMKSDLQVREYSEETKKVQGYHCHKVTIAGLINAPTLDEIWIAKLKNVPDLIFPEHLYFLIEGIPMEIVQDFEGIKIKWGVVDILPVKTDDIIFNQNNNGYEVSVADTAKLIYEGITFIRTYQPKID